MRRLPLILVAAAACSSSPSRPVAEAPSPPAVAGPAPVAAPATPAGPPATERRDVTDTFHGVSVADPYRWLEGDDDEVKAWTAAQDRHARAALDALPQLPAVRARVAEILGAEVVRHLQLTAAGTKVFALRHLPPRQQIELVVMDDVAAPSAARVVLDPTTLPGGATNAVDWFVPSADGSRVAVSVSQGGSERGDLHLLAADGTPLEAPIPHVQNGTAGGHAVWSADGKGVFYTRYPRAGEPHADDDGFYQQLWYHALGTPAAADRYELGKDLPRIGQIRVAADDRGHILASIQDGDSGVFRHHVRDGQGRWRQLTDWKDQIVAATFGPKGDLYLVSFKGAPRGKVLRLAAGARRLGQARVVIGEGKDAIVTDYYRSESIEIAGGRLFVTYQTGGPSELRVFSLAGKPQQGPAAPPVSAATSATRIGDDVLFVAQSYVTPSTWLRFFTASGTTTEVPGLLGKPPVDLAGFEVIRELATSKDGTRVPLNIVWPRGAARDGKRPCLVTGYGGFGVPKVPGFVAGRAPLLEAGLCFVEVNLRGGTEFGEDWHQAGMLTRKQNVFDDLAAALEHLIQRGYTAPAHLAIEGGSNGGLLVGALLTQRPELIRVAVAHVGILDSLRNELTTNGTFNVPELGSVTNPDQFRALHAYSPYHRVVAGTRYPAVLLTTGANDVRVAPWHSKKMAAALQAATAGDAPILLRVEGAGGHGAGTPLATKIEQSAHVQAFVLAQLGVAAPAR
jgi:prolyl oligopeptidase